MIGRHIGQPAGTTPCFALFSFKVSSHFFVVRFKVLDNLMYQWEIITNKKFKKEQYMHLHHLLLPCLGRNQDVIYDVNVKHRVGAVGADSTS